MALGLASLPLGLALMGFDAPPPEVALSLYKLLSYEYVSLNLQSLLEKQSVPNNQ